MYWEGFLRSLASDIWVGAGVLFMIAIFYSLVAYLIKRSHLLDLEEKTGQMWILRAVAGLVVIAVFIVLFGRAASVAFANRIPRQDINRNPVYEQMDSHGQKGHR